MSFLHKREHLEEGDIVVVDCSHQCNVMIADDTNFSAYKSGGQFKYYGGHYALLPTRIVVPSTGYWNITLDLGGRGATVKHSITIVKHK